MKSIVCGAGVVGHSIAEKLSKETSYLCNLDLAIMSNKDLIKKNNNFNKYYFKCRNKLIGLHHILPYSIKNAFWTSNIFNFIVPIVLFY